MGKFADTILKVEEKPLWSLKFIRTRLESIRKYEEIYATQISEETVNFLFIHKVGLLSFFTNVETAKELASEIDLVKAPIKVFKLGFEW